MYLGLPSTEVSPFNPFSSPFLEWHQWQCLQICIPSEFVLCFLPLSKPCTWLKLRSYAIPSFKCQCSAQVHVTETNRIHSDPAKLLYQFRIPPMEQESPGRIWWVGETNQWVWRECCISTCCQGQEYDRKWKQQRIPRSRKSSVLEPNPTCISCRPPLLQRRIFSTFHL